MLLNSWEPRPSNALCFLIPGKTDPQRGIPQILYGGAGAGGREFWVAKPTFSLESKLPTPQPLVTPIPFFPVALSSSHVWPRNPINFLWCAFSMTSPRVFEIQRAGLMNHRFQENWLHNPLHLTNASNSKEWQEFPRLLLKTNTDTCVDPF